MLVTNISGSVRRILVGLVNGAWSRRITTGVCQSFLGCHSSSAVHVKFSWRLSDFGFTPPARFALNSTVVCRVLRFLLLRRHSHRIPLALPETQRCYVSSAARVEFNQRCQGSTSPGTRGCQRVSVVRDSAVSETRRCYSFSVTQSNSAGVPGVLRGLLPAPFTLVLTGVCHGFWRSHSLSDVHCDSYQRVVA